MSRLKSEIYYPFIAFIVVIGIVLSTQFYLHQNHANEEQAQQKQNALTSLYKREIRSHEKVLLGLLEAFSDNNQILSLFENRDRDNLYNYLEDIFLNLRQELEITHFYFINPDRSVFLRIHNKDRYGEVLNRKTLLMAEDSGKIETGIELGTFGILTLRAVKPIYYNGDFLGYLELGGEVQEILEDMDQRLDETIFLYVDKRNLKRESWETGAKIMGRSHDWEQYDDFVANFSGDNLSRYLVNEINSGVVKNWGKDTQFSDSVKSRKIHLSPIWDANGNVPAMFMAIRDVSQQNNTEKQFILVANVLIVFFASVVIFVFGKIIDRIERRLGDYEEGLKMEKRKAEVSSASKSAFLSTMSHELRTPLNAIIGFSDMIRTQMFGPIKNENYVLYAESIHDSGQLLLGHVDEILHLSDIEDGLAKLNIEDIELESVLVECRKKVEQKAALNQVSLEILNLENIPKIRADRMALKVCVENLLTNAVKFSHKGSTVRVRFEESLKWNKIIVEDNGIGIHKDDIERILEPFTQVEREDSGNFHEGSGLGLTITKNLVEMHGGILDIESERNEGTKASLFFPIGHNGLNA